MRTIRSLIFDLDGTLIDSAPDLEAALNRLLAEEGRRPLALGEVTGMIGDGAVKLVERAFAATGGPAAAGLAELTRRFLALYEPHAADETRPFAGVPETLASLAGDGCTFAVCTNKPERATRGILRALGLEAFFPVVVGGDTLPGARKPDPTVVLATLERLGTVPGQAVMVGDSANDVLAGRAAGLAVIVCANGYSRIPAAELGADLVIGDFTELPSALSRLS